mmetsp:Transcript_28177/g.110721  ORF Transcript_28177/g.110721 Transcript_28177/m.110721 type:complete len:108 (-) Transcript_28177:2878-3201(-)
MACFVGASIGRITKKQRLRSPSSSHGLRSRERKYLTLAMTSAHLQPKRQGERIRREEDHGPRQHISVATYNVYMVRSSEIKQLRHSARLFAHQGFALELGRPPGFSW